jgi:protein SCO1/2
MGRLSGSLGLRDGRRRAAWTIGLTIAAGLAAAACGGGEPAARRYELTGQILAVHADRQQLTIKHEDIPDFMPGMTMSFPVTRPELMTGRTPGELIKATLEVQDSIGRLVEITHTGTAPLPDLTNVVGLAEGLLDPGDEVPDAAFVDQTDTRRSFSEWRGQHTLVTFVYTSCPLPTYCPLMDQNFAMLQRAIAEDAALAGRVKLVSVSVDPVHDTPAVLAAHAAKRKSDPAVWTWLTGDRVTVDRFAARFGVGIVRPADGGPMIDHTLRTAHVGPDGRLVKIYSGNEWTPGGVLDDLRRAVRQP